MYIPALFSLSLFPLSVPFSITIITKSATFILFMCIRVCSTNHLHLAQRITNHTHTHNPPNSIPLYPTPHCPPQFHTPMPPPRGKKKNRSRQKGRSKASSKGSTAAQPPESAVPRLPLAAVFAHSDALRDSLQFDTCKHFLAQQIAHRTDTPADREERATLLDLLGELLLDCGDAEGARKVFQQSVDLLPDSGFSKYMNLGQISASMDNPPLQAVQYYKRGIAIMRDMKRKIAEGGKAAEEQAGIGARELSVLIGNGCCSIADLFMTDLCHEPHAEQECEEAMRIAMEEGPDDTDGGVDSMQVLQTLASVRLSQSRPDEARGCMQRVMQAYTLLRSGEIGHGMPEYDFQIGTCKILMELGEFAEAEALLVDTAKQYDEVADLWYLMGVACQHQRRYRAAMKHYTHAVSLAESQQDDPRFVEEIRREMDALQKEMEKDPGVEEDDDDDEDDYIIDGAEAAAAYLGARGMGEIPPDSDDDDSGGAHGKDAHNDDDVWDGLSTDDDDEMEDSDD